MEALGWDRRCLLLTNHALVLAVIAEEPGVRIREIAERVEITERAVESLLTDLISVGFLSRKRVGRRNAYQVHGDRQLRHPLVGERTVSGLLSAIRPARAAATPEVAFAGADTDGPTPEQTLSCANRREGSMVRAATTSTKEGVTMKRVLVYMVVASLLAFATAALAATTGGHHKLRQQLRRPAAGIQGIANPQTNAAGATSASAGVAGRTGTTGPAKVSTNASGHAKSHHPSNTGSGGGAVTGPSGSTGGSVDTTVGTGSTKTTVSVGVGKGGVTVGISPSGGNPISIGVSPPGSGQPPITVGGQDPLSGLGL